jgi:hypothetical protein
MDMPMDDQNLREPHLDALLRPALLIEPPAAVQQSILAAVLRAAQSPLVVPLATIPANAARSIASPVPARTISPLAYLLLGAVLLAYAGLLSWIHGFVGGTDWISPMVRQLLVVLDLLGGQSLSAEPLALAGLLIQVAPWLLLLPLAWLLWDRDRTSVRAR